MQIIFQSRKMKKFMQPPGFDGNIPCPSLFRVDQFVKWLSGKFEWKSAAGIEFAFMTQQFFLIHIQAPRLKNTFLLFFTFFVS